MMRILQTIVLCVALIGHTAASEPNIVTAAHVNGTWENRTGVFKVWALGRQRLQVEFSGVYEYRSPAGLMANIGDGSGIAFIEGDTAAFKPDASDDDCRMTMWFQEKKLIVDQEGTCGFGHNVTATGTYGKVRSGRPEFGK